MYYHHSKRKFVNSYPIKTTDETDVDCSSGDVLVLPADLEILTFIPVHGGTPFFLISLAAFIQRLHLSCSVPIYEISCKNCIL